MSKIEKSFKITDVVYDKDTQTAVFTFLQNEDMQLERVLSGVSTAEELAEEIKNIIIKYYC